MLVLVQPPVQQRLAENSDWRDSSEADAWFQAYFYLLKTNGTAKPFRRKLKIQVQGIDLKVIGINIWVESMGTEYMEGKDND